jgi:ATP dependent DNA ligase-like protein
VPDLAPMLADRGLPRGDLVGWAAEPKLDGWRAVVVDQARPDGVVVRTRRGHGITSAVPGIGALAELGHRLVLDGELVAGAGTAGNFYGLLSHLVGRRHPGPPAPVSFLAFDLLWIDGEPLLDRPYIERRQRLEDLRLTGPCGVPLKRLRSIYRPGERTRHWRHFEALTDDNHRLRRRAEELEQRLAALYGQWRTRGELDGHRV